MKTNTLLAALCALFVAGCATPSANPVVASLEDPNKEAMVVQLGTTATATSFLANKNNSQYATELVALADALILFAQGNPQNLTAADIKGIAGSVPSVSASTVNEIATYATAALGILNSAYAVKFPTLKPAYNIFLLAVANGLKTATGGAAVPLPVIPWPPVATPTPATS